MTCGLLASLVCCCKQRRKRISGWHLYTAGLKLIKPVFFFIIKVLFDNSECQLISSLTKEFLTCIDNSRQCRVCQPNDTLKSCTLLNLQEADGDVHASAGHSMSNSSTFSDIPTHNDSYCFGMLL